MKERDIRNREAHGRYLALLQIDAESLARDRSAFSDIACPACDGRDHIPVLEKFGYTYVECRFCLSLFVNPRPSFSRLTELYADSPSTRYWVEEFFRPVAEARRAKIFAPRAQLVVSRFPELSRGTIGDIGAGFGLFVEELGRLWSDAAIVAIEPSTDMAKLLRDKHIPVIQAMLEEVDPEQHHFDLLTSFELFEHLHAPERFLRTVFDLLNPGGHFLVTTLSGIGFDIQLLWEHSRSLSPPIHLNFFNPRSIATLFRKTGFEVVDVSTPGDLDWDIVEGAIRRDGVDAGRFPRTLLRFASDEAKAALQHWIRTHGFSSHMRAIARKPK